MVTAAFAHRRALIVFGILWQAAVLAAFARFEVPGLGLAHLYYLGLALIALGGGRRAGALGGVASAILYAIGVVFNPTIPSAEVLSGSTGIRLVTYTTMGLVIGWFADHDRDLVARLRILAERDFLTGLPNTRAFEAAIARRTAEGPAFLLLLGDMDGLKAINDRDGHAEGNEALRRLSEALAGTLRRGDEVARVGGDEFALLTSLRATDDPAWACNKLERLLAERGTPMTFGWAQFPQDGDNPLALYRAADERLYARKLVRGRERLSRSLYPVSA